MNIGKGVQASRTFKVFEITQIHLHPEYLAQMHQAAELLPNLYEQYRNESENAELYNRILDLDTNVPRPNISDVAILTVKTDDMTEAFLESVSVARVSTETLNPQVHDLFIGGYGCTKKDGRDGGVLHATELLRGDYRIENAYFYKKKDVVQGCVGDSGGPVYLKQDPPLTIVGINSYVSENEDAWTAFTRLDVQSPGKSADFLRRHLPQEAFTTYLDSGATQGTSLPNQPIKPSSPPSVENDEDADGEIILEDEFNDVVAIMISLGKRWVTTDYNTSTRVMTLDSLLCSSSQCNVEGLTLKNKEDNAKLIKIAKSHAMSGVKYRLQCIIAFASQGKCIFNPI